MTTYRERLERRADQLEGWADSNARKAHAAHERAHELAERIPFGQPILVGHHSQRRAERDRDRIHNDMRASIDSHARAVDQEQRAGTIRQQLDRAIYDDNPDALERLRDKLAALEEQRATLKTENARRRKAGEETLPAYVLANLGGNITRARKRIAFLEKRAAMLEQGNRGHCRTMTSRYGGTCADCGATFDRGDPIGWYRLTKQAVCSTCATS
jgi:DNA repair exonuclease SbcCD ATPase subunit